MVFRELIYLVGQYIRVDSWTLIYQSSLFFVDLNQCFLFTILLLTEPTLNIRHKMLAHDLFKFLNLLHDGCFDANHVLLQVPQLKLCVKVDFGALQLGVVENAFKPEFISKW